MDLSEIPKLKLTDRDTLPDLVPFNPEMMQPRDIGTGYPSTEITVTQESPDGKVWNIPSLWWTPDGEPVYVDEGTASRLAYTFEKKNKVEFPRFPSKAFEEASKASQLRSKEGGASGGLSYSPIKQQGKK